jgi:hypothetical protein
MKVESKDETSFSWCSLVSLVFSGSSNQTPDSQIPDSKAGKAIGSVTQQATFPMQTLLESLHFSNN